MNDYFNDGFVPFYVPLMKINDWTICKKKIKKAQPGSCQKEKKINFPLNFT